MTRKMKTPDTRELHLLKVIDVWRIRAQQVETNGASLRDHFAGQAMQWILSDSDAWENYDDMAESAYQAADAMLRARAHTGGAP